jgi:uncharacterized protein YrrD
MDEGLPTSYEVLGEGVPVLASDGSQVGTVGCVLCDSAADIFHGLLIEMPSLGLRFVEAGEIASIHEHGVDLRIDAGRASALPKPEHSAPVYDEDPAAQTKGWRHWVHHITGHTDWHHES